jgi:hypothetical protein
MTARILELIGVDILQWCLGAILTPKEASC